MPEESPTEQTPPAQFESALAELEQLVKQMEQGDMTLEASLAAYERGVELTRLCEKALRSAELRIRELKAGKGDEGAKLEDLNLQANDAAQP